MFFVQQQPVCFCSDLNSPRVRFRLLSIHQRYPLGFVLCITLCSFLAPSLLCHVTVVKCTSGTFRTREVLPSSRSCVLFSFRQHTWSLLCLSGRMCGGGETNVVLMQIAGNADYGSKSWIPVKQFFTLKWCFEFYSTGSFECMELWRVCSYVISCDV